MTAVRVGYHNLSDNSVSSSVWAGDDLLIQFLAELLRDEDVDEVWLRNRVDDDPCWIKHV